MRSFTPPLDEFGEIRGMSISKTTTAKSCKNQKNKGKTKKQQLQVKPISSKP